MLKQAVLPKAAACLLLLGVLCLGSSGCQNKAYVNHPGSANTFDSQSYDALNVANSLIVATKADLASNKFTAPVAHDVATALNNLITAYDAANTSYQVYHTAALAGNATSTQQADVQNKLAVVASATSALTTVKGGS